MSPFMDINKLLLGCFPRVSGDEPAKRMRPKDRAQFSPRERG